MHMLMKMMFFDWNRIWINERSSIYMYIDENNVCLTEIEAGLQNPAYISVKRALFHYPVRSKNQDRIVLGTKQRDLFVRDLNVLLSKILYSNSGTYNGTILCT